MTEVEAVDSYDREGIWEGEKVTFDETVNGEYLIMGESEIKEKKCERMEGNQPVSLIRWALGLVAVDELGQLESVHYCESREGDHLP